MLLKKKNPVLLKDEDGKLFSHIGKAKPSTFDLPKDNHTYGKKVLDDPEPMKYGNQSPNYSRERMGAGHNIRRSVFQTKEFQITEQEGDY